MLYVPAALIARDGRFVRGLERFWVWFILRGSNVKLSADGLQNMQAGNSCIVMANHRSMYDIPALHYLLGRDRDLRWIGKHELTRVPVFGWAFGMSRHVAIDRQTLDDLLMFVTNLVAGRRIEILDAEERAEFDGAAQSFAAGDDALSWNGTTVRINDTDERTWVLLGRPVFRKRFGSVWPCDEEEKWF